MRILGIGIILILFGLLAVFSTSTFQSLSLNLDNPSNYFYFFRQITNIVFALIAGLFTMFIPIKFFQKHKTVIIIFVLIFILQLLVFVPGVGMELGGARGWIDIPVLPTVQPAEFFKIGFVLFMANWLLRKRQNFQDRNFLSKYIIINGLILGVFFFIPDLGTVLVLGLVSLIMLRFVGGKLKHILIMFFSGIILAVLGGMVASSVSVRFAYYQKRMTYFLNNKIDPNNTDIGRQNHQALIAIGGGGFLGEGYGKGLQKLGYIPEAESDFIFAAFSEEIGFLGNMILLGLYFYLCYYFLSRLHEVKDEYTKTIGVGIISLIIVQMFVNLGVNMKIMPNTGLTLPFISYGGTALMVNVIEIVLLYKILQSKKQALT